MSGKKVVKVTIYGARNKMNWGVGLGFNCFIVYRLIVFWFFNHVNVLPFKKM